MRRYSTLFIPGVAVSAFMLLASRKSYRSVSIDESGQLHITLDTGEQLLPQKSRDQVAFAAPFISPDHKTVGWLVQYPDPTGGAQAESLSGGLVLYRHGHVLHKFSTEQVFWDWQFRDSGNQIAYSTGPTHGGATECVLRDVDSGQVLARWSVTSAEKQPAWADTLRQ